MFQMYRTKDLGTSFKNYFEIVPAYTDELKTEAYKIRHQVYCEDLKFEPTRPDKIESDEYDADALHLLIRNIHTKEFVGCTRIVYPQPANPHALLPIEKTCSSVLDRTIVDPQKVPRNSIAEVSRLAVIAKYRRRKGENNSACTITDNDFDALKLPRFPYIPIGLYLGSIELARVYKIKTLFILTEERLANHFNKLGFGLKFIGDPINHRGERLPSMISIQGVINGCLGGCALFFIGLPFRVS